VTEAIEPALTETAELESRSYYGQPILKEPVWGTAVPEYFFLGGLAGASAGLAFGARLAGNDLLARNATFVGLGAIGVGSVLLIEDLGRRERFLNMFRVVKVTSPMSVGTWILSGSGAAIGVAAGCEALGILPRVKLVAQGAAGLFGLPLTTYTAALLADTAVPAWHDARLELPFVFAGSAAASAGAAATILTPSDGAGPARRLAVAGAVLELASARFMEQRLGRLVSEPYRIGAAGRLTRLARACTAIGAAIIAFTGRRRAGAAGGGALVIAGSILQRLAVFRAGQQSARDPKYTVVPQRRRLRERNDRDESDRTAPANTPPKIDALLRSG
jgi:hypothetical protein